MDEIGLGRTTHAEVRLKMGIQPKRGFPPRTYIDLERPSTLDVDGPRSPPE